MTDETTGYRLNKLEEGQKVIAEDVKTILSNHIPHLQVEVAGLSARLTIFGSIILTALGIILAAVITH